MPDGFIPIPFREPVWRFVGVLSVDSGYYVAQFDEEDSWDWDSAELNTVDVTAQIAAPPPVQEPDTTFAAQPVFDDGGWAPEQTEDYASDSSLDVTSQLFPPAAVEPTETFA